MSEAPSDVNKLLDSCTYPGWKITHTAQWKFGGLVQYATGYHQGPVAPPRTDGAQLLGVTGKQALLDGFDAEMVFFSNGHLLGYLLLTNWFSLAFCQTQKSPK